MGLFGFLSKEKKKKLNLGLARTRENFFSKLSRVLSGRTTIDKELIDQLEEVLLSSDIGVDTTLKIIDHLEKRVSAEKMKNADQIIEALKNEIVLLLSKGRKNAFVDFSLPDIKKPYVLLVVGVNGVGKTTTIGKLAGQYKGAGYSVLLGAADTFRAAAVDQLSIWSDRTGVPIIKQAMGADPASVAFDAVSAAVARNADVVIIDTAGRLHNKANLMAELTKIKKVISKVIPDAPHEVMLVLDATTGQNAIEQCRQFTDATDVNTLALTKLDGTAKGGVVIGISDQFNIPVKYIGVGEGIEDLQLFNAETFAESLFAEMPE